MSNSQKIRVSNSAFDPEVTTTDHKGKLSFQSEDREDIMFYTSIDGEARAVFDGQKDDGSVVAMVHATQWNLRKDILDGTEITLSLQPPPLVRKAGTNGKINVGTGSGSTSGDGAA